MESEIFNVPLSLIKRFHSEGTILPEYRTEFMRDRDRLMYATAFRRLAGKTQIYTVGIDDHKKNRLTHTLEVAQIARTIAQALNFNSDLAEAIALSHDFGHSPFGHAGEDVLHEIMVPNASIVKESPFYGNDFASIKRNFQRESKDKIGSLDYMFGFKHNLQSVRVSAMLEDSYRNQTDDNIGLNLTNFTLYGMMIHSSLKYNKEGIYTPNYQNLFNTQMKLKDSDQFAWSFEAYIVKWADDIAQWHHDLEDALREGVLPVKKICTTIHTSLGKCLTSADRQKLKEIQSTTLIDRQCLAVLSHVVVNTLVNDLYKTSRKNLKTLLEELKKDKINDAETLFRNYDTLNLSIKKENVINLSDKIASNEFKGIISESIHHSRNVERMNEKGRYIIRKLFEAYYAHPQQLPDGPILHLMVEIQPEKYPNIDAAKETGIGQARVDFDGIMKNPNTYTKCMLMRRICDHIASMTDHYAIEEYNNLYG